MGDQTEKREAISVSTIAPHSQDDLLTKERHLLSVLEAANIIPWEADPQTWRFTYIGSQAESMLGYPLDQWYEKDFWTSTIFLEDREFAINFCETSSKTLSNFDFEYRMVKADGNLIWLRDVVNVEFENGVPQILRGCMIDITATKRLEHLYSVAPIGLCYFDMDLRFLYINDWLARINGLSVKAHLGKSIGEVLKEVAAGVVPQLRQVLETGEPIIDGEIETETPAHPGESRHYMHNYYPDKNKDGTIVGVSCVVQDITERKRAKEALLEAHEQLEDRVQDRTQELRVVNKALKAHERELQESADSLRSLAGKLIVAQEDERRRIGRELHDDLTQNLAILAIDAGRLEQQAESTEGKDTDGLRKIKERIIELSEYVHTLSRQLHPAIVEDLGIADALRSLCEELEQNDGVLIDCVVNEVSANVPNDQALCIYRVAQEALRNIVKHSRATQTQVHLYAKKETLEFEVRDNGIGFNMNEAKNRIGLGLKSMEERVWLAGGTVRVESRPGNGTVVSVSIPLT